MMLREPPEDQPAGQQASKLASQASRLLVECIKRLH